MIYALTDEELGAITELAAPLPAALRGAFVEVVLAQARAHNGGEIGAGLLHRIGRDVQRGFAAHMAPTRPEPAGATLQHARRR
jgi:hypothetical protein